MFILTFTLTKANFSDKGDFETLMSKVSHSECGSNMCALEPLSPRDTVYPTATVIGYSVQTKLRNCLSQTFLLLKIFLIGGRCHRANERFVAPVKLKGQKIWDHLDIYRLIMKSPASEIEFIRWRIFTTFIRLTPYYAFFLFQKDF